MKKTAIQIAKECLESIRDHSRDVASSRCAKEALLLIRKIEAETEGEQDWI